VEETDERGQTQRSYHNRDTGRGTPQGAPLSPLLANLYMRRFIRGWKELGHERRLEARIVNYADDFVICCRGTAEKAMQAMRSMMARLRLTVNERKTRICRVPGESFKFLSYLIGRCYSPRTGDSYLGLRPAWTAVQRLCRALREKTSRKMLCLDPREVVISLNLRLAGWANYFQLGQVSPAYRAVDQHVRYRLRQWLRKKHKVPAGSAKLRFPDQYLYQTLGLIRLEMWTRGLPWAKG
jgi:RNA-directed DNA polymerase